MTDEKKTEEFAAGGYSPQDADTVRRTGRFVDAAEEIVSVEDAKKWAEAHEAEKRRFVEANNGGQE